MLVRHGVPWLCTLGLVADAGERSLSRSWRPERPLDLRRTLSVLRHGSGDPAYRVDATGAVWRASRTPEGPATLRLSAAPTLGEVRGAAWGPGASWILDSMPGMLGADDDASSFRPAHPLLCEALRRFEGWRVTRTGLVMESLVPAVLEQKVTGKEATRSWRELLWRFGTPAPGPGVENGQPRGMYVTPSPKEWALIPSWSWHKAGVDGARVHTIIRAAEVAGRLEETTTLDSCAGTTRLRTVSGIGPWTAAEVRQRAHGDADAISVGDYHLPTVIGWSLIGKPVDDDGMLELLEPYAGQRHRAATLIVLAGGTPPRRGPRYAGRDYRAV